MIYITENCCWVLIFDLMIKLVRNWFVSVYLDPWDLILRAFTLRVQEDRYLVPICQTGDKNLKESSRVDSQFALMLFMLQNSFIN